MRSLGVAFLEDINPDSVVTNMAVLSVPQLMKAFYSPCEILKSVA